MKMSRCLKPLTLLLCALAAFCFAACSEKKQTPPQTSQAPKQDMRQVVKARVDIGSWVEILTNMVELTEIRAGAVLPNAATNLNQVVGKVTRGQIQIKATEQVRLKQLTHKGRAVAPGGIVPSGTPPKLFMITIKEPRDNPSALRAGDHVDIVCCFKHKSSEPLEVAYRNVYVIHFDPGDTDLAEPPEVLVAVTAEQYKILSQAEDYGTIRVSLPKERKP
jgi:Flp pilus assembly protein CpaB